MVAKTGTRQIEMPIEVCFKMIESAGSDIGWKLTDTRSPSYLKWKVGGIFSMSGKNFSVEASLKQIDATMTIIQVTASSMALVDGLGLLQGGVDDILGQFDSKVQALAQVIRREATIGSLIGEGLLCPTCGRQLEKGTLFCPNDGTKIMKSCSNCNTSNIPLAQFCSSCGAKF